MMWELGQEQTIDKEEGDLEMRPGGGQGKRRGRGEDWKRINDEILLQVKTYTTQ